MFQIKYILLFDVLQPEYKNDLRSWYEMGNDDMSNFSLLLFTNCQKWTLGWWMMMLNKKLDGHDQMMMN